MPQLTANLSRDAKSGWDTLSRHHGATVTGLIEAIGRLAHDQGPDLPGIDAIVQVARSVDMERRHRAGRPTGEPEN